MSSNREIIKNKKASLFKRLISFFLGIMILLLIFISVYFINMAKIIKNDWENQNVLYVQLAVMHIASYQESVVDLTRADYDDLFNIIKANKNVLYAILINRDDKIIYDYKKNNEPPGLPPDKHVKKPILSIDYSKDKKTLDILAPVYIGGVAYQYLRIGFSTLGIKQKIQGQYFFLILVILFIGLIASLLLYYLTSILKKPLEGLMEGVNKIMLQNLDHRINVKTNNELGELAVSFNNMAEMLQRSMMALADSNKNLEKKVQERTGELKSAYEKLKTTQAQLIQSAKMASVGFLAGGVAHEINNPLTGVLNNVQLIRLIREKKNEFSVDDFNALLNAIEESAIRCKKITQSLLDFSHASKGTFQDIRINEITERVCALIGHELQLENIIIQKKYKDNLPLVKGDIQLLQQVIFDIISNAKWAIKTKTGKNGGTINIETDYDKANGQMVISISDDGIGIPKENFERVFDPFFTTKPIGEGTGLGLSIAYNIIKAHSGTIEIESEEKKGARFIIRLPASH